MEIENQALLAKQLADLHKTRESAWNKRKKILFSLRFNPVEISVDLLLNVFQGNCKVITELVQQVDVKGVSNN